MKRRNVWAVGLSMAGAWAAGPAYWQTSNRGAVVVGIPNVVFISDACRSRADSLRTERVVGSIIFPNGSGRGGDTEVDKFLATHVGFASYEVPVAECVRAFQGIYGDAQFRRLCAVRNSGAEPFQAAKGLTAREAVTRAAPNSKAREICSPWLSALPFSHPLPRPPTSNL